MKGNVKIGRDQKPIFLLLPNSNITFMQEGLRFIGTRGDIGIVKASINCIKQILKDKREGYIIANGTGLPTRARRIHRKFLNRKQWSDTSNIFRFPMLPRVSKELWREYINTN